jgi:hypothetical protein
MSSEIPSSDHLTSLTRQMIQMYPERFGITGSYSREMLRADSRIAEHCLDRVMVSLTTSVMCGRTVSEHPQVELNLPASWWQHLKWSVSKWRLSFGFQDRSKLLTAWLWVVARTLFLVLDLWVVRRPVKWTTITASLNFEQRVLYPELDHIPAVPLGRPVIYETLDVHYDVMPPWGSNVSQEPDRFMNRHEVLAKIAGDAQYGLRGGQFVDIGAVLTALEWLERHGVNVDQLVKRH